MADVLLVCGDAIGRNIAGPAIRVIELARALAVADHSVTVASAEIGDGEQPRIVLARLDDESAPALAARAGVVVGQGWPLERWPELRRGPGCLVVDLYDPYVLEGLVLDAALPLDEKKHNNEGRLTTLGHQLDDADFLLCASERQRDLWLGALMARGRINTRTYAADPSLRRLVDTVPFGLPAEPPHPRRRAIRSTFPTIGEDDVVLFWGGGLYDWFDPLTLVRAVALAATTVPHLRLVFQAAPHPSAAVAPMSVVGRTRALSAELGLTGRHVFFNEAWIPYDERADWLCDADIGVSTHHPHIETEFAFRTRLLDCMWARLPILCSSGDVLAAEVENRGLGIAVPPEDSDKLADAIVGLSDAGVRARCRERIAAVVAEHSWSRAAEPLVRFCANPQRAPDRVDRGAATGPEPAATPTFGALALGRARRELGRLRTKLVR